MSFGPISLLYKPEKDFIGSPYHMEADLKIPGNILLSESDRLLTIKGSSIQQLARLNLYGKTKISAFYQLNESSIVVSDLEHYCLVLFDRVSSKFSHYSGLCNDDVRILVDGNKTTARFTTIDDIIKGPGDYSNKLIVLDFFNHAIRHVDLVTQEVGTIYSGDGLKELTGGLCVEHNTSNILIGGLNNIIRLSLDSSNPTPTTLVFDADQADLPSASRIIHIVKDIYLATTTFGLRLIDLENNSVKSLCQYSMSIDGIIEGKIGECVTRTPRALLMYNDRIYFGLPGSYYRIGQLPGKLRKEILAVVIEKM